MFDLIVLLCQLMPGGFTSPTKTVGYVGYFVTIFSMVLNSVETSVAQGPVLTSNDHPFHADKD